MEVKRNTPEPVEVPPDTIDILGLSLREGRALRELVIRGLEWNDQPDDLGPFFQNLYYALDGNLVGEPSRDLLNMPQSYC